MNHFNVYVLSAFESLCKVDNKYSKQKVNKVCLLNNNIQKHYIQNTKNIHEYMTHESLHNK